MSRIHEALKKAELERVSLFGDSGAPNSELRQLEETRPETSTSVAVTLDPPRIAVSNAQPDLHFENVQARCAKKWGSARPTNVFDPGVNAKAGEQFRTLRSRLYQLRTTQPLKTLLVTSAVSGEGKTFLATNLGYAIARQAERRVLLIDADLRHSQMHLSLGAESSPGLTEYLRGDFGELDVIQYSPENNLCFIAGGSQAPNPSELLSNGRLTALLERVAPIFEWIIVDSPPSLPVADASVLAGHCDALLIVVRARVTPFEVVQKGCMELQGHKVAGVVLNAVQDDALAYGYYHPAHGQDYVESSAR